MITRETQINAIGQPIGWPLDVDLPCPRPERQAKVGQYCTLVPLSAATHGAGLWDAFAEDTEGRCWTYLPNGPYENQSAMSGWLAQAETSPDPMFFTILAGPDRGPAGHCTYLRINEAAGSIEVGFINYAPRLQRTPAATEAMFLMMAHAFDDLGYRRYEWKCDALNAGSRRAAERLGFSFEGIHRQATHYKGRNRDTAWYSILDSEWPRVKSGFTAWLSPDNFDDAGQQRRGLADCSVSPT